MSRFEQVEITDFPTRTKNGYGALTVSDLNAVIAGEPTYGLVPANFRTFTDGSSGSAGVESNYFKVSTGTTIYGYGAVQSFRSQNYRTGQSAIFRFAARFPDNVANSQTGVGCGNVGDELSFGYNGTTFGIWHRYFGRAEVQTLQITAAATGAETAVVTINSTVYNIPVTNSTVQTNAHEIAAYLKANASGINAEQNNDTVTISFTSDGDKTGTFSLSSAGTCAGTFTQRTQGMTKTSVHIPQASWNGDPLFDGFDPAYGNNYEIIYKTGYGAINFLIENPLTGDYVKVHTIRWSNANTTTNMSKPSLRALIYAYSVGSTTDIEVHCAYIASFISGTMTSIRNPRGYSNNKSISTTPTNILTLEIEPRWLTLANDGSKQAVFSLITNATLGGTPNFQDVGTNLVSEIDVAGTTITGGTTIATFTVARLSSVEINLKDIEIRLPPTLTLTVTGYVVSGAASDLTAALVWYVVSGAASDLTAALVWYEDI